MRLGWFIVLVLLTASINAAYIHGSIYGVNLEKLNKTYIKIEGPFSYFFVTEKSNYSIFLPEGEYVISAEYSKEGNIVSSTSQKITVGSQDQSVDLVLRPPFPDLLVVLLAVSLVLLVALGFIFFKRSEAVKSPKEDVSAEKIEQESKPEPFRPHELDGDAKAVLAALDSFDSRATQTDLKDALGFSDAKLSLILTELEHMNLIKKFKRGRGNIIKKL